MKLIISLHLLFIIIHYKKSFIEILYLSVAIKYNNILVQEFNNINISVLIYYKNHLKLINKIYLLKKLNNQNLV